ncbi:poly-beta-1,6-N-acetyl-D-glucosamine N-deacetylase PgaB [Paraburkholderia silviterrae]|uniref:Poly-beta-1,6-N-acetyl-D-glucosamine N-deacetylase PgaB n=1 Tax=Paraburkholderia silviterrae TaxID=2528715 RepID=A0A4R5M1W2_9BURK|nr:poly-beta-1,6-N-acetyl-D-glucosamine N-deacetylase PgaB [Paraburkholderia silviterrae]TDG19115.1 poly-beta-1,6-N-acetyl-D-glucosamine N-deacetylase PgaB [Paraburkholderia silviterrae]
MQSRRRFICSCLGAMAGCSLFPSLAPAKLIDILPPADPADGKTFRVICFHDVRDNLRAEFHTNSMIDPYAVDTGTLTSIFSWLDTNHYNPVTFSAIVASRNGGAPLPPRSVLLTFDDGFKSHHDKVLPLLKQFRYPGVMGIVTSWIDTPANSGIRLSDAVVVPRDTFMSWDDVRNVAASGLVELACHTHDLHHGAVANPQGNELPAATSHLYLKDQQRYETDAEFESRVHGDLGNCIRQVKQQTGVTIRSMVWPYGAQNLTVRTVSARLGMPTQFTLESGPNTPDIPLDRLRRILATYDIDVGDFERSMREPAQNRGEINPVERPVVVSLDDVYDPSPDAQEKKLGALIERMYRLKPSSVYLQAFSDPSRSGLARALYFPNRHLPMRSDLFCRAAWQLNTRASVEVYAWMPVLAFAVPEKLNGRVEFVTAAAGSTLPPGASGVRRLSPFDPAARAYVRDLYEDLGKYSAFNGVLFGEDATLSDFEDDGRHARQTYASWGLPGNVEQIRANPEMMKRWGAQKTRYLLDFTKELRQIVLDSQNSDEVLTVRTIFPDVLLDPGNEARYAQNYPTFVSAYDFVGLLAMPSRQGITSVDSWLDKLGRVVQAVPDGPRRTVFLLEATDSQTGDSVPTTRLTDQMRHLREEGMVSYGYYPDNFAHDLPNAVALTDVMSTRQRLDPASINVLLKGAQAGGVRQ